MRSEFTKHKESKVIRSYSIQGWKDAVNLGLSSIAVGSVNLYNLSGK